MNKTIIININGIVFHIEEDAYEVLRLYMTEVKRHFAYSADSEEIVTDIENRLAEMFNERLAEQNKQVIVLQDVHDITARMGSVNDFDREESENGIATDPFRAERKLYRDTDDRVFGGVCAGLGHYFDVEAKWVRVIALVLAFTWGFGILLYILLWIIIPNAKTRAEKMAMKGEAPNLQNFKKNFDEELEALKYNTSRAYNEVKPGIERTGDFIREAGEHTGNFMMKLIRILVKVVGAVVIFAGVVTLISLIMGLLFTLGFFNATELDSFPFNVINPEYQSALYFSAFVLIFIPLIALILFAARVLFNSRLGGRTTSFSMLIIWLTALGFAVYYGSKVGAEFKEEARIEQKETIQSFPVLYLKLNAGRYFTKDDTIRYRLNSKLGPAKIKISDDFGEMDLYIEKSDDSTSTIFKEFSARGKTFESALQTAQKSQYHFTQTDSILELDKYLYLPSKQAFRDQEVDVTLRVPVNTRLVIDGEINQVLDTYNLRDCLPEDTDWKTPSVWIMTNEGLKCSTDTLSIPGSDKN